MSRLLKEGLGVNRKHFCYAKVMKRINSVVLLQGIVVLTTLPIIGMAFESGGTPNASSELSIISLIDRIFSEAVWPIVVAVDVIGLLLVAVLFLSAHGDPEKIAVARKALWVALVGVVLGILSFSIPLAVRIALLFV